MSHRRFTVPTSFELGPISPLFTPIEFSAGFSEKSARIFSQERFAVAVGNIYGIPIAGRTWANERDRVILEELPKQKRGWIVHTATYDPCVFIIRTPVNKDNTDLKIKPKSAKPTCTNPACQARYGTNKLFTFGDKAYKSTFISCHTDDLDMVSESSSDIKEITDFLDKQFAHDGNPGVKVIDKSEVLGVKRIASSVNGTRRLQLLQDFKCQELWDAYGEERHGRRPPTTPFPIGDGHPALDNDNRVVGGSEAEGLRIHSKGYRKVLGSILWIARNATPMASYAASILSKCMQQPTEVSWDAAMHTMHYLFDTKDRGITFRSDGNLEPVCYYDSGFNQQTKLQTHPQYGFIIFWCAAPRCTI